MAIKAPALLTSFLIHLAVLGGIAHWPATSADFLPGSSIRLEFVDQAQPPQKKTDEKQIGISSANENNYTKVAAKNVGLLQSKNKELQSPMAPNNFSAVMTATLRSVLEVRNGVNLSQITLQNDKEDYFLPHKGETPKTDFLLDGVENGFGNGNRKGLAIRFGKKNGKPLCPGFTPIDTTFTIK